MTSCSISHYLSVILHLSLSSSTPAFRRTPCLHCFCLVLLSSLQLIPLFALFPLLICFLIVSCPCPLSSLFPVFLLLILLLVFLCFSHSYSLCIFSGFHFNKHAAFSPHPQPLFSATSLFITNHHPSVLRFLLSFPGAFYKIYS